MSTIMEIQR